NLYEEDQVAVVLGNRYATEQFEGYARVHDDACDLLSMGGLCGIVESRHDRIPEPTRLRVLGALGDRSGEPLKLEKHAMTPLALAHRPRVAVVCGGAMDIGKTHTARSLVRGLRKLGSPVAGIKLTGTAAGRDTWSMHDAGARPVFDFIDAGLPSTYLCSLDQLLGAYDLLMAHAGASGAQWVVIEIADGILQRETMLLVRSRAFGSAVDAWIYGSRDAPSAVGGVGFLRSWGIEPVAISGLLSMSPLSMREASLATTIRCITAAALQAGELNEALVALPVAHFLARSRSRPTPTPRPRHSPLPDASLTGPLT